MGESVNSIRDPDPKNYGEAMRSKLKDKWQVAMSEELQAIKENDVWVVVNHHRKSHVLHTKWVFKTKTNADGSIGCFKTRLVACGSEQVFGVDYGLIFAAVMELSTVKLILVFALRWGYQPYMMISPTHMSKPTRNNIWIYSWRFHKAWRYQRTSSASME